MKQATSESKPQRKEEKELYTTPELDKQEPLQDITAINHTRENGTGI